MQIVRWSEIEEAQQHPGHHRRQAEFDTCYLALHRYLPGGDGYDLHSHPETQAGFVLFGEMAMIFPEGPRLLQSGEAYVVPTCVEHGGKGSGVGEAMVVNLYVKRHLVGTRHDPVWCENWADGAPREIMSSGVIMRREALPRGERSLEPVQGAHDIVHVLLDGEAEIVQDETTSSLSPADAIRWSGLRGPRLRIGENGASFLRFALM